MNKIYTPIILLASCMSASLYPMERQNRPRSTSPLQMKVLLRETAKDHNAFLAHLKETLPDELNSLFHKSLIEHLRSDMPQEEINLKILELQEGSRELLTEQSYYKRQIDDILPFDELEFVVNAFKIEKGFLIIPKIEALPLKTIARFYATHHAITTSLKKIAERIGLELE